jgi:hypothetical protein
MRFTEARTSANEMRALASAMRYSFFGLVGLWIVSYYAVRHDVKGGTGTEAPMGDIIDLYR